MTTPTGLKVSVRLKSCPPSEQHAAFCRVTGPAELVSLEHTATGVKLKRQFHATFPENATNAEVYKESVEYVVKACLDKGLHGAVCAHSTGSVSTLPENDGEGGLILLALQEVFDQVVHSAASNHNLTLRFRCLQIRNDNIEDVLHRQRNALHLTSNPHQGKSIRDASVLTIDDFTSKKIQEVFKALHDAVFQHSVDQAAGRRGHLLLTVTFEREDLKLRNATLNLVELARLELEGSRRDPRRVRDSQAGSARGDSWVQQSILSLRKVLTEACKSRTVCAAYRESKLTRLLEPSFRALANGEGQFSFICTLHRRQMQEVKHSLNLASELYRAATSTSTPPKPHRILRSGAFTDFMDKAYASPPESQAEITRSIAQDAYKAQSPPSAANCQTPSKTPSPPLALSRKTPASSSTASRQTPSPLNSGAEGPRLILNDGPSDPLSPSTLEPKGPRLILDYGPSDPLSPLNFEPKGSRRILDGGPPGFQASRRDYPARSCFRPFHHCRP
ncbi:hypothetical protein CYMTET_54158 [Cymbomonas tetramitiformis]|uniref:Kinesin motor domain-containing protein n=1 Tax=Cymbomonas tetramitiformis TaxID=36881 RepID=A0AAE0BFJ5_9CHLO|nr:hypothetical protein CYMTET_54158 [Cymbomonas tetramitiformis]